VLSCRSSLTVRCRDCFHADYFHAVIDRAFTPTMNMPSLTVERRWQFSSRCHALTVFVQFSRRRWCVQTAVVVLEPFHAVASRRR
jgi:hypothetical protein